MGNFYVYAYFVPGSAAPFYIGKGAKSRYKHHLQHNLLYKGKGHFYNKLRRLIVGGQLPEIRFLKSGLTEQEAFDWEIKFIEQYGRAKDGGSLCNHTDGGEGVSGHSHSADTIEAIKYARARQVIKGHSGTKGSRLSQQARMNQSAGTRLARGKAVVCIDRVTGDIVKVYDCIIDAESDGFNHSNISAVCNGRRTHHKNFKWEYLDG